MVDGEILFEWKQGYPILFQPDYKQVIPTSKYTTNKEPKGNVGQTSSYLGGKKEIPQKTTYQRTSHSENRMNKIMNTRQKIPEIILMFVLRS